MRGLVLNDIAMKRPVAALVLSVPFALLSACANLAPSSSGTAVPEGARATLALLESTDVHSNIRSYDYYQLAEDPSLGYERLATLVREARKQYPNSLLFDVGDTIQGTALADYQALVKPVGCDEELAMYRAMDALGYDGATVGNHEFNYGLPFLAQVTKNPMNVDGVPARKCKGPNFPIVLSNVFGTRDGKPIYAPYGWVDAKVDWQAADGRRGEGDIRVGLLGFTPPPILQWDKMHLEGKLSTKGLVEAAREYLPELRAQNTDLVVALSHGGLDARPYNDQMENANWYLAQEPGIDALLLGHSHAAFPDPGNAKSRFANMPGVDNERGFVHGKPAVMGSFWGKGLGVIELALVRKDGRWQIDPATTHSQVRSIRKPDGSFVEPDAEIARIVEDVHEATIRYVSTPIGDSDFAMTTYFADVGDVTALQPVNSAQRAYVERYVAENLPQYANVPVLSAAAPFKGGFGGANDYTDIPAGPLAIRNAADLYLFPNTLTAVKVDGAGLKAWLEQVAGRFNQIDPNNPQPQELVNPKYLGYNFDVLQGDLSYEIDVTQPRGSRIRHALYKGKPIADAQAFIVVTNNYRASGGGHFPGLDGSNIVVSAPDANRDALIEWVKQKKHLVRTQDGADRSWHFTPVRTAGPVTFVSAAAKLDVAKAAGLKGIRQLRENGDGKATYAIDLAATR